MADSDQAAGFWLPAEFLTDDDFKQNSPTVYSGGDASFPPVLRYHFHKSSWVMSTSPQSTLDRSLGGSGNGSPQGVPSPPATPFAAQKDVRDLISRAAGQVTSLKLSDLRPTGLLDPRKVYVPQHAENRTHFFLRNSHFQKQNVVGPRNRSRIGEMGQAAWKMSQNPTRLVAGAVSGRKSAGTGVFLPRVRNEGRVCNGSDSRKKPSSFGLVPDRTTNHVFTKNYGNMNAGVPRFDQDVFVQDYETLMARREAIILQQRRNLLMAERSSLINRDMYLPPEWTY